MSEPYHFRRPAAASTPLLVSIPHTGTEVPDEIAERFAGAEASNLPDTDWHLHDLYDFAPFLGARTIFARYSRYVVDLNRPRDRQPLYPGRFETSVVPTTTFTGAPIYRPGMEPDDDEISERLDRYWMPYHERIQSELAQLKARFGYALLFEAHSITSWVPQFHQGRLPGLMLGDANGTSAAPELTRAVVTALEQSGISHRLNDPFQGGHITRSYGQPRQAIHALQLEMSQRLYMDEEPPFRYRDDLAAKLRPILENVLREYVETAEKLPRF